MQRDINSLVQQGWIEELDQNTWCLAPIISDSIPDLKSDINNDISLIVSLFRNKSVDSILDYVYKRYPEYTVKSRRVKLVTLPRARMAVYTIGYEGKSVDEFLNILINRGIQLIIDVRHNPIARSYGYHKSTIRKLSEKLGIDYLHFQELGVTSEKRQSLKTKEDYRELMKYYKSNILMRESKSVDQIATVMKVKPSILMCVEKDPSYCHRTPLANEIAKINSLPVVNLA